MEAVFESEWEDGRKQGSGSRTLLRAGWAILRAAPGEHFDVLRQDVKTWWRSALRTPSSTLAAVATLALGIGTSSALFGVLLRFSGTLSRILRMTLWSGSSQLGGSEQGSVSTRSTWIIGRELHPFRNLPCIENPMATWQERRAARSRESRFSPLRPVWYECWASLLCSAAGTTRSRTLPEGLGSSHRP